ncbi:hypothetical protein, partial [Alistipes communis]|uniref:hypothetical protein n=1 Tax=Alistipes communis TaxID=2585118 RepID=UPI003A867DFD
FRCLSSRLVCLIFSLSLFPDVIRFAIYQFIFSEGSDTVRNTPQQRTLRPPQAYCPKQRSR